MNLDKALSNTRCLGKACNKFGIPFVIHDDFGNWLEVSIGNKKLQFINRVTPFNNGSIFKLCKDKEFSYRLFSKEIKMAKTKGFVDPNCNEDYSKYVSSDEVGEVVNKMIKEFKFPFVVKMNSGSFGNNIFVVNSQEEVKKSVEQIYNKDSENYDYLALAQEFIDIEKEFRVIWFKGEALLIYEKVIEEKNDHISPMFNPGAKTVEIPENDKTYKDLVSFFKESKTLEEQIEYAGFDVAVDKDGKIWLLEINASPILDKFARDNGDDALVVVYEKMLNIIQGQENE